MVLRGLLQAFVPTHKFAGVRCSTFKRSKLTKLAKTLLFKSAAVPSRLNITEIISPDSFFLLYIHKLCSEYSCSLYVVTKCRLFTQHRLLLHLGACEAS